MTNWSKENDNTTGWKSAGGYKLATLDGRFLTTLEGKYLTREGITTAFGEVGDVDSRYIPFGVGLYIGTEDFDWITTEGGVRLIHSATDWGEVDSVNTTYIKEIDA